MEQLDSAGGTKGILRLSACSLSRRETENRAQPFAAGQHSMSQGLVQLGRSRPFSRQAGEE
jgi:hypothetical protein